MNELEKLSVFINKFRLQEAPSNVIETTKICILDSFAVSVGSSKDRLVENVVNEYKTYYPDSSQIKVWGQETKLPVLQAIFINSLMGHRLELDDVHTKSKTHIGTVVVPTTLCLGEWLGSTGEEIIEAVICGYEVMSRIGMGFGVSSHRNKGWHVTSTAGTFGAAAAATKLLKLNTEQIVNALGMAGTQSFGLWAFLEDSANSKILHPGRAAQSGTEAAMLAKAGMTGPRSILDAKDGSLYKAMSDEYDLSLVSKDLGVAYEILYVDNKPYPCCRSTHCTIDSALKLRNQYNITIDEIDEINVDTYLVGYKQCGLTEGSKFPVTPTEAKFSTPYTVATALIYGGVTIEHFNEENISNELVQTLLKKVKVQPNDAFTSRYPKHWGCNTKIKMLNGTEYEVEIIDALGSTYNPVSKEAIKNKVFPLLSVAYEDPETVICKILNLGN
jgi:2-methylcitrate dehydratase PrpD